MEQFKSLTAKVIPLPMKDIDTDMIYPAQFLTSISRNGLGKNLFYSLRSQNPQFVFNQPRYTDAGILVTDSNFGCGSSREHAVWALLDAGYRVIISKSFADIFSSNSAKNGLLLVTLPDTIIDDLLIQASNIDLLLTVDLEKQEVRTADGQIFSFTYDPFRRYCILNGLDDIDYILSMKNEIGEFRKTQLNSKVVK